MQAKHSQEIDIQTVEGAVGYVFKKKKIVTEALTHRSFLNENRDETHNERLEFLGDAVLQFVATAKLYNLYPDTVEGVLSMYRSLVVKTEFLINVAKKLNLQNHLRVSIGQRKDLDNDGSSALLANTTEAMIGAIYQDGGLESAEQFIHNKVLVNMEEHLKQVPLQDSKTALQEKVQREIGVTPEYVVLNENGPDHEKIFTVGVKLGEKVVTEATGKSKQDAAQNAAKKAMGED